MLVAAGQFAVTSVWEKNAEICASLMAQAAENDVSLFVLPEALLARDDHDADLSVKSAQLLEGEFLGRLRRESKRNMMTTILTIHVPSTPGRAWNMLVALRSRLSSPVMQIASLRAFAIQESRRVDAGNEIAPLLEVEGMKVGLMTCYDLRFQSWRWRRHYRGWKSQVLPAAHRFAGRSKGITGQRCLPLVRWIPDIAAGGGGREQISVKSRVIDPFGVRHCSSVRRNAPALIIAEVTPGR